MRASSTLVLVSLAAFSLSHPASSALLELTSRPATGDTISWEQFFSPQPTPFPTPASFASTGGIQGTATLANDADGTIYEEGGNFAGNFAHGDLVFYTMNSGPLTLNFNTALSTVGAQIDANTYGSFTAQIQAFHDTTLLGTFVEDGSVTTNDDNSAIFLGVTDTNQTITRIIYSLTASPGSVRDFAINHVNIEAAPQPVPEPGTLELLISAVAAAGAVQMKAFKKARHRKVGEADKL